MADQTPGHDPLDDRLRATFAAEHADIERRRVSHSPASATSRSNWLPMAIAAALVMLAGFAWFGTRPGDDAAIGLDVAGQPTEPADTDTTTSGGDPDAPGTSDATPGAVSQNDPVEATSPTPTPPAPTSESAANPTATPVTAGGFDTCSGIDVSVGPTFVWGLGLDDPDGGLVAHTDAAIDARITRVLPIDASVAPTGQCRLASNGTPWFEINGRTNDWVSSSYLRAARPACLEGEQYGAQVENGDPQSQIFGPVSGWAIRGAEQVAFLPGPGDENNYRWYPTDAVAIDVPCFPKGPTGQSLCLSGNIQIFDFVSPEPLFAGTEEMTVVSTGRLYTPIAQRGLREEFIEVTYGTGPSEVGFVDPAVTTVWPGECGSRPNGGDSFDEVDCTSGDSSIVDGRTSRGSTEADADHVHNLRVEERLGCTRLVIEFGRSVDTADALANQVPLIDIRKTVDSTIIGLPPFMLSAPGEAQRLDFTGGTALFTLSSPTDAQVTVLHAPSRVNVWFLEEPARVIIDIKTGDTNPNFHAGPIVGEVAVLTAPIQADRYGAGLNAGSSIEVRGYARPFEAQGNWYVLQADATGALTLPVSVVASGTMQTTTWIDGWGHFSTTVPGLEPGFYIALFGEHPAAGDVSFIGSGQYFRIGQSPPPGNERYADAERLQLVEIVDPFWE